MEFDGPEMRRHLSIPGLDPAHDCFIASENRVLTQAWQSSGPNSPSAERSWRWAFRTLIRPKPVEQALVDAAVARACDLPVSVIHVQTASEDGAKRRLLYDAGFLPVRRYATMRWRSDALPRVELPEGFTLRSFRAGHDAQRLTDIQNAAFGDSWGFSPNTVEQVEARVASKSTTLEGILLVTRSDDLAAYNWTVRPAGPGGKLGRIAMTGVHPAYRGQGLSRPTVLAGMDWLASQGVDVIDLEMDSSNLSAARVYESLGFEKVSDTVWFESRLGD